MSTQTPRQIAFDDIREGDRIACENTNAGVTVRYGGVVGRLSARAWYTDAGGLVVASGEPGTITLLHRPAPTEPTGLGAVVRATLRGDSRRQGVFVRSHPGPYGHAWRGLDDGWDWPAFDPDSIEVLSEGIEVEQ